jgi:hypothetical protein
MWLCEAMNEFGEGRVTGQGEIGEDVAKQTGAKEEDFEKQTAQRHGLPGRKNAR